MSESIFSAIPSGARRPLRRAGSASIESAHTIASSHDASLLAILTAPLRLGEPAQVGFLRKETELRAAFAALSAADSRALHARLANPRPDDALAAKFAGLVVDRKQRLLGFLADARRREAIAAAAANARR
ncbi:MAG TPA: hypothetical protein VMJ10_03400 [Kofleriaceae bacterium]|nr:hypothetical protein [Kofleriaceae bacterium]